MMEPLRVGTYLGRLWLEGLVIVLSILAAFLLDAWWTDRESRIELALELTSIRSELELNRQRVHLEIVKLERITAAGDQIRKFMDADPDASTVTIPDSLAWLATVWAPSLGVSLGAVDALIASGHLAQIENPELRSGLAGIKGYFDNVRYAQEAATRVMYNFVYPAVIDKVDFRAIYRIEDEVLSERRFNADMELPSYTSVEYPNSLTIRNSILDRSGWLRSAKNSLIVLLGQLDLLIKLTTETE
jgi:hypothetical protein